MITFPNSKKVKLKKFFKTLVLNLRKKSRLEDERKSETRIILGKEGRVIALIGKEIEGYREILQTLFDIYPKSKNYGKSYAEQTLKEAIWSVLKSKKELGESWKDGLKVIRNKYQIKPTLWSLYFPVSGINFKGTKWIFGSVSFCKLNNRSFRKDIGRNLNAKELNSIQKNISCFLNVKIKAADFSSAVKIAKPTADLHIATLNALSNIAGSSKSDSVFSSYMIVGESVHSLVIAKDKSHFGFSRCMSLNLAGFNPHVLRAYPFIKRFGIKKISKELKKYDNSLFLKRIFPALKWTGRAVCQDTNEEVFLCYCLALESILYDSKSREEVVETLQRRVYKLLFSSGSYLGGSIKSYNKFEYLYEVRSKVVHRGETQITDDDIFLIRDLVIGSLYKVLYHKSHLSRYRTSDQFEKWLSK